MIQIDMQMPKCCDECFALDEHGDYPFCLISQDQRGYTFNTREKRMSTCPLKAQEPRVMTLEEFQVSENNPKWLETKDGKHNRWTLGNAGYEKFYDNCMMGYLPIEEYGKRWRCWTSRPTDAEREAIPWND